MNYRQCWLSRFFRGVIIIVMFCAVHAHAWRDNITGSASAGWIYEDELVIQELDQIRRIGDTALFTQLNLGYEAQVTSHWSVAPELYFSDSRYRDAKDYNLTTQIASLNSYYQLQDSGNLGLYILYADVDQAKRDYLSLRQVLPQLGYLTADGIYWQVSFGWGEREFAIDPERSSDSQILQLRAYYLLDGLEHSLKFSGKARKEDALSTVFDYRTEAIELSYRRPGNLWTHKMQMTLSLEVEYTRYPNDSERNDRTLYGGWQTQIELGDRLFSEASIQYTDNHSSIEELSYQQMHLEWLIGLRW